MYHTVTSPDRPIAERVSHIKYDNRGVSTTDTMETRKVQISGGTTYTISLPKSWAREHNVDSDTILYLQPKDDGTIVINTAGTDGDTWETTVDVSTYDGAAVRETLVSAYMIGFDRLALVDRNGFDETDRRTVTDLVSDLVGITVDEVTDTCVEIRSLIDPEQISIRKSVVRLRLVTLAMQRDAATAVVEANHDLARQVVLRDTEADKLFALLTRYFRRSMVDLELVEQLEQSRPALFEYYYVARQCERIADHAEKMATLAIERTDPLESAFVDDYERLARNARTLVENASDVVLEDAETEMAYRSIAERDELIASIEDAERSIYAERERAPAYELGILLDSVKRTAEYGANIAELAIQRSLRRTGASDE